MKDYWCLKIISTVSSFSCKFAITIKSSEDHIPKNFQLTPASHPAARKSGKKIVQDSWVFYCIICCYFTLILLTRTILVKLLILYRLKLLALSCFQNVKCGLIRLCRESHEESAMRAMPFNTLFGNGYGPIQINVHLNFLLINLL